MNFSAKMFRLSLILTAVFCAPVIKDPLDDDLARKKQVGVVESETDKINRLVESLKNLIAENDFAEKISSLNKSYNIDIDELLGIFETYIIYRETTNSQHETVVDFENNSTGGTDTADNKSDLDMLLPNLFAYIDENMEEILNELIYAIEESKNSGKDNMQGIRSRNDELSSDMFEAKVHEIEELVEVGINAEQSDKILKRASSVTEMPKEAPLVDVEVDVGAKNANSNDNYDLRRMYEKRGAICTLIKGYSKTPIYVISTCRLGFARTNIWELCERRDPFSTRMHQDSIIDITRTPVQDQEGFVYRNVYCAQCNDITLVQAWTTKIDCEHMQPLSLSDGKDTVTLMKEFTENRLGCIRKLSPAIPRMIHQCSHVDVISTMRYHTTRIGDSGRSDTSPFPLSFSILMNFGFDGKTHILFSTTANPQSVSVTCNLNEKYDPQFQKCRPIVCYDGYQLVGGTCEKITNSNHDPDDLANLQDTDEPLQVVLTIKNVTNGDIYMLRIAGIEGIVIENLADMFNISRTRIQNLTLGLVNTTGMVNRTEYIIEIHRFTTPLPSKIFPQIQTSKKLLEPDWAIEVKPTQPINDMATKRERDPKNTNKVVSVPIIHPENDEASYRVYGTNDRDEKFAKPDKKKGGDSKGNQLETDDKYKSQNDRKQMTSGVGVVHHDDSSNSWNEISETLWNKMAGLSVRISFILTPAHKNRTLLEKSVKTVVQSMSNLIYSNTFSLTINGTNYKVQGVENAPQGTSIDDFCKKGVHPMLEDNEFIISAEQVNSTERNGSVTVIIVKETGERFLPGEYDLTVNIESRVGNISQAEVSSFAFVCKMPKIVDEKCGRIVLDRQEYNLFDNKSIAFANRTYNMSEYEYVNLQEEVVSICTPSDWATMERTYESGKWTLACGEGLIKVVIAESYLTFILGVISLICMLSVLITYGLFDKLRNLPGVNTMNLTFSLFMGELVFITSGWIQPHQAWLCSAVGMLLHYLFLATFFWMNVMSFDVFRTFGNKCILTRVRKKKKYFPRYLLYAWGSPFLIVALCGVIDYTDLIEGVEIGYGGSSVSNLGIHNEPEVTNSSIFNDSPDSHVYSIGCWIQQPVASMAAFGGPMILILLGNTVMFIKTIICIRASTGAARLSVRRQSLKRHMTGRDDVMLYVRMSTVMGFTWVFGLASSVISAFGGPTSQTICIILHLLGILFIVFNCSQGIFIFFAFLFNRRILAMYKGLLERLKSERSRPISVSSSRATLTTQISQSSLSHIT
ncbi:uncharacterized protein LOC132739226 [Ruditapes philippinarum]|uniref:uncharacterized protein LOC132739226 n=1 Tax=Ruditapes philippinarum TaxID=129788 RepID=UPI00295B7B5A|nr:uncharacterized protein LOC132739226 [Ruditapes philippinarum]